MRRRRMIAMMTMALAMGLLFAPKGVLAQTASTLDEVTTLEMDKLKQSLPAP